MSDVLGWFNSMKKGFIDMVGSENRRSKIYASCSEVLRKLATCSFWVGGFKENHTLWGCIQGSKTTYFYKVNGNKQFRLGVCRV